MLENMLWQVVSVTNLETSQLFDLFGQRYDFTDNEMEILRLLMLFGFDDSEIKTIMQLTELQMSNHLSIIMGKSRTNSIREVQALFLRFSLHRLPT